MPVSSNNKFSRARRHLRSTQIDEKLQLLNEIPTNNTTSYYTIEPDVVTVTPAVRAEFDLTADDPALVGKDTSGLFDDNGAVLTQQPPGDTTYILGPMVSVYFPDGDYSAIGYIQKDTRKVINLARIPGEVKDWALDGTTEGFTSYSQLTLEQALWYRDQLIAGDTTPYRVFYIGVFEQILSDPGVTDPSAGIDIDAFGRWLGQIINLGNILEPERRETTPGKKGSDPNLPPGSANPLNNPPQALKDLLNLFVGTNNKIAKRILLGMPSDVLNGILKSDLGKEGIAKAIEVAGKLTGLESATNMLNDYNKFLSNPNGPGSNPNNRFDASSSLSPKDYTNLANAVNTPQINNLIRGLQNNEFNTDPINTPIGTFTEKEVKIGSLKTAIENAVNNEIYKSEGLDNSLHNNVQVDIDKTLETGKIVLTKEYVFRPGGSVERAEKTPVGKVLNAMGVPLDTAGSGSPVMTYAGFAAHAIGLNNASKHGGVYNAPGMFYQVTLPMGGNLGESKYSSKITIKEESRYKNLKKPYTLPEAKKEKIKHRPKVIKPNDCGTRVVGADLMKQAEVPTSFKRIEDTMWKKQERAQNTRFSQERKNMILDSVGTADHAWEWMTDKSKKKNEKSVYENFGPKNSANEDLKNRIISKKQVGNDSIIKMYNENGEIEIITQSVLNERLQKEYELQLKEQETLNAPNDPLVKRIKNKLYTQIDYPDKPAISGYPNEKPKEMSQGWHPEYGDRADYYNRLDRHSADTMSNPLTGNEKIDAKVLDQTTSAKVNKLITKMRDKKKQSKINSSLENQ